MPNMMDMTHEELTASMTTMAIAQQNDQFRKAIIGGRDPLTPKGRVVVTAAVAAKGLEFELAAARAVAEDTTFTEDNDPHGDRTFGTVEVMGEAVWWKIDLYDEAYEWGSSDPANKAVTHRVLTILFPSDY